MSGRLFFLVAATAAAAGWIAASAGVAAGIAAGLVGASLTVALHRRAWVRPLVRLRDRLEAAGRGVVLPPDSAPPRSGLLVGLFAAAERLESRTRAGSEELGDPWAAASLRLDAHGTVEEPEPLAPQFEAALDRLLERERRRAFDLHRSAADVAAGGIAVLDALDRGGARWRELGSRAEAWEDRSAELLERLGAAEVGVGAARAALEERSQGLSDAEKRLEASFRAAAAGLARVAALEQDLDAGRKDLEQLERLVAGLGRAAEPERRLEWVGEARATLAHWSEARASWSAEAARARDQLASLADALPAAGRRPDIDGALEGGLADLARLARAWAEHASSLQTLAAAEEDEARARREEEARLRRGLAGLALIDTADLSNAAEDALIERLRIERAAQSRAESSEGGLTEETLRTLQEIEARGARARRRLEDFAGVLSGAREREGSDRDSG